MLIDAKAVEAAALQNNFTGIVAVDVADERVYERGFGFAHRANGVPNTPATRFALASGSKLFTALGILRLVELGRLGLADPVRPILGNDLPLIDSRVTVEQLLDHTSGIGDYLDEEADWDPADYVLPVGVHTLADTSGFLPVVDGFDQVSPAGERFAYCNGAYIVLAIVAERVSGLGYHELLAGEVFARAGLRDTAFLRSDELPGDAALGYLSTEGNRTNVLHLPVRGNGDGGAYSTAADLHTFWRALLAGRIVGADVLAEMVRQRHGVRDGALRPGLGIWLHPRGSGLVMEGMDAGVSMRSVHDPSTGATATVLGNTSDGAWPIARLFLTGKSLSEQLAFGS